MADNDRRYDDRRRERDRDERESRRDRDRDGGRDRDRGGDRRDRDRDDRRDDRRSRRSRSRDRDRSRSRSKSPSGYDPNRKRRRPTWFDIPPVGGAVPALNQLPDGDKYDIFAVPSAAPTAGFGGAASQQATRHARRIYVGGLPPSAGEQNISIFFSNALAAVGGTTAGPGQCVVNVYINYEKKFAFVEFRTVEEASNAMALDGIMFEGVTVRVRRPADYNPAAAAALGPSMPNPNLNLAAIGLDKQQQAAAQATANQGPGGADANERVFVGGLPYYLTEEQCRELLGAFGAIKSFDLVKDRETGHSKGYGFCVYEDPRVTDIACQGLNGMRMGDRTLTVRRATEGQKQQAENALAQQQAMYQAAAARVVKLAEAVTLEELQNDDDYNDIMEDMREECSKYGTVNQVHIPRPPAPGMAPPPGLGKVLIEFADPAAALLARNTMHGRKFGGRTVTAVLVTEDDYKNYKWD
ncbi:hypothetical protein N2152v2_001296 [Parachlorella kessleri]